MSVVRFGLRKRRSGIIFGCPDRDRFLSLRRPAGKTQRRRTIEQIQSIGNGASRNELASKMLNEPSGGNHEKRNPPGRQGVV